jgi:hypothetical protein
LLLDWDAPAVPAQSSGTGVSVGVRASAPVPALESGGRASTGPAKAPKRDEFESLFDIGSFEDTKASAPTPMPVPQSKLPMAPPKAPQMAGIPPQKPADDYALFSAYFTTYQQPNPQTMHPAGTHPAMAARPAPRPTQPSGPPQYVEPRYQMGGYPNNMWS